MPVQKNVRNGVIEITGVVWAVCRPDSQSGQEEADLLDVVVEPFGITIQRRFPVTIVDKH